MTTQNEIPEDLCDTPPTPCNFKVGDQVTFINDYGVVFENKTVIGFAPKVEGGRFVYFSPHDAWWFPVNPKNLIPSPREAQS